MKARPRSLDCKAAYGRAYQLPLTMYRQTEKLSIYSLTILKGVHKYNAAIDDLMEIQTLAAQMYIPGSAQRASWQSYDLGKIACLVTATDVRKCSYLTKIG